MGLKLSCIHRRSSLSRQVSLSPAPARVIAADGSLNEVHGASASDVLGGDAASPPLSFVCSSDALYFNESPPALGHGEPLRPGQIYFVLPAAMLGRPLSSADMAELAVLASAALAGSKPRRRRGRGRNGSKNKTKVRVMPVLSGDAEHEDVDFVNEKINEQTLGQFGVLPISPARSNQKLAATEAPSGLKRALSVIREDAM